MLSWGLSHVQAKESSKSFTPREAVPSLGHRASRGENRWRTISFYF